MTGLPPRQSGNRYGCSDSSCPGARQRSAGAGECYERLRQRNALVLQIMVQTSRIFPRISKHCAVYHMVHCCMRNCCCAVRVSSLPLQERQTPRFKWLRKASVWQWPVGAMHNPCRLWITLSINANTVEATRAAAFPQNRAPEPRNVQFGRLRTSVVRAGTAGVQLSGFQLPFSNW